jgi:3-hydroxyacyl-[acyl-carrier-protein] dehydratase
VTALTISDIKRLLPHRHPMLLLDTVTELVAGQRACATKAVSAGEPWYRDVPDDAPVSGYAYPAVLVVESWCQCAALLAAAEPGAGEPGAAEPGAGTVAVLGGLSGVTFERDVYPGEVLEHRARLVRHLAGAWIVEGESRVGQARVLHVEQAMVALRAAEDLPLAPATGV